MANGETDYCPSNGQPIRLRVKGRIADQPRARVPLTTPLRLSGYQALKTRGESYERNGHTIHLGHFALDAIDPQGT